MRWGGTDTRLGPGLVRSPAGRMETGNCHLLKRHRLVKYPSFSPNAALGDRPQGKGWAGTPSTPIKPTPAIAFVPPPAAPTSATRRQRNSPPPLGPPIALIPQDPKNHRFPHYIPHPCSPEALSGTSPAAPIATDAIDVSPHPRGCRRAAAPTQGTAHGCYTAPGTPVMPTHPPLHKLPGAGTVFICFAYSTVLFNFICITNN